jgi:1-acyl-sn-glycerol-3-phosphate acyltransferase
MSAHTPPRATLATWIGSTLYHLFMALSLILLFALLLLSWPLPYAWRAAMIRRWTLFLMWLLKVFCGLSYQVQGWEHLPERPYVALVKHQSAWETIASNFLFRQPAWVFKRELLWLPVFGWGLALTNPIAIDRGSPRKALAQLIEQGEKLLARGRTVVIFPEGTRVAPGQRKKYEPGGSMLAVKTATPVIPVAHDAGRYWPKNSYLKYPGTIRVKIGPLIETSEMSVRELNQQVEGWIEGVLADDFADPDS